MHSYTAQHGLLNTLQLVQYLLTLKKALVDVWTSDISDSKAWTPARPRFRTFVLA